jgi:hypothetical protein
LHKNWKATFGTNIKWPVSAAGVGTGNSNWCMKEAERDQRITQTTPITGTQSLITERNFFPALFQLKFTSNGALKIKAMELNIWGN